MSKVSLEINEFQNALSLLDSAPDAMVIVNSEGIIRLVNRQTENLFGYGRDELLGKTVELLMPVEFRTRHINHREGFFGNLSVRPMGSGLELLGMRKDGTAFPVEISLSPIETSEGLLVSSIIRDVTDRKRSEERQAMLASIVESSEDAIISNNLDGTITSWNNGALKLFGYTPFEAIGKPVSIIIPTSRLNEENRFMEIIKRGRHIGHFETERMRKDGSILFVSLTVSPIKNSKGIVTGASKIAHDITERKKIEASLLAINLQLEESNKELEAFSYSVSHDLQAPLRHIIGFGEELRQVGGDEYPLELINKITTSASKMSKQMSDLLKLSRAGKTELNKIKLNLADIINDVISEYNHNHNIVWRISELPDIVADPVLMRSVITNLFSNAVKYSGKKDNPVIEFNFYDDNNKTVFFIKDNGVGFDMRFKDKLFGIFQRLHRDSEYEGSGVGLAAVKRIINRHGGRTWAESELGSGTTVYFTLPENTDENKR